VKKLAGLVGAVSLLSAACITAALHLASVAAQGSTTQAVGSTVDLASFAPFHVDFSPADPPASSISEADAVSAAIPRSIGATDARGDIAGNVIVNAQYGIFTDHEMTMQPAGSSESVLEYQNVGAWIVTFTGPRVGGVPDGGACCQLPAGSAGNADTEAVVIDSTSGHAILTLD
jgi:hypothetical protein